MLSSLRHDTIAVASATAQSEQSRSAAAASSCRARRDQPRPSLCARGRVGLGVAGGANRAVCSVGVGSDARHVPPVLSDRNGGRRPYRQPRHSRAVSPDRRDAAAKREQRASAGTTAFGSPGQQLSGFCIPGMSQRQSVLARTLASRSGLPIGARRYICFRKTRRGCSARDGVRPLARRRRRPPDTPARAPTSSSSRPSAKRSTRSAAHSSPPHKTVPLTAPRR